MTFRRISSVSIPSTIRSIHLAADGCSLVASFWSMPDGKDSVWVLDIPGGDLKCSYSPTHSAGAILSSDGSTVWFQGKYSDASTAIFSARTTESGSPTMVSERGIGFARLHANRDCTLLAAEGSNIEVWDIAAERPVRYLHGDSERPITCAFSTDSQHLYVAQSHVLEKQVLVTGEVVDQWEIPGGYPGHLAISASGRFIAYNGTTKSAIYDGHEPLYTDFPHRLSHSSAPVAFLHDESGLVDHLRGPKVYRLLGAKGVVERTEFDIWGPVELAARAADAEVYAWVVETRDEGYFIVVYERV